jgi:hypothetical protein
LLPVPTGSRFNNRAHWLIYFKYNFNPLRLDTRRNLCHISNQRLLRCTPQPPRNQGDISREITGRNTRVHCQANQIGCESNFLSLQNGIYPKKFVFITAKKAPR